MGVGGLQPNVETLPSITEPEGRPVKTIDGGAASNSTSPLVLQPLNTNVSFRDQAYAALKQAIMEADIYAHADELRLDERQLSQSLGVSRTPIREAMTLLEQEGFLRTVPRRGIFIVRKTKKQIVEMIEMWAAIESMAARLATLNASDEEIAGLRRMFDEFRNSTPAEHIDEYSDANIAFHQAIIRLSGSHLMGKTIENLFIHVRAIRRLTISQSDRASRSIVDHMRIIEALERRDTELAERLVRQHSLDLAAYVEKYCDFLE
jgi:DNA-binding GntR family transcriptional regulator